MSGRTSHNAWLAGGLATALLLLWFVTTGDTASGARLRSDPEALRLLRGAEGAARDTSYEGVQYITSWSRSGMSTTSLVNVAHVPGQGTRMRVQSTTAEQGGQMFEADGPQQAQGGLTGYTSRMLDLLARNYAVVQAGEGQVCGRPTTIIEARRADGTAAGRFHIDRATGLMLRRELLDQQGRAVNLTFFTEMRPSVPKTMFVAASTPQTIEAPWTHQLVGADLGALRYRGWPVASALPGHLSLYDARQHDTGGPVVHLSYSDGLSVVSVFVQRGVLDPSSVQHWHKTTRGGRTVYLRDTVQQRAVWASRGYVYTIVADAPPPVVDQAVAALPHGDTGFWGRIGRGLDRLTSWANPFD
ncbi:sigma-E factor regulatory protein RseB domain-containing protein [Actinoallomurus sp. NPDC052308]|uniref:sigma-E factor regulatory protein RseB domain-containing protein n=1 Tax=Actinoallomurus sp. NPDC052308 TaxID=3155530 RepID=UPI00341461E6